MSIDIDGWDLLNNIQLKERIVFVLNSKLASLDLPGFLTNIKVHEVSLGDVKPSLEIVNIINPSLEFYEDIESRPPAPPPPYSEVVSMAGLGSPLFQPMGYFPQMTDRFMDGNFRRPDGATTPPSSPVRARSPPLEPAPRMLREIKEEDFQLIMKVQYDGNLKINITADLAINHPSPEFITLPVRLQIIGLELNGEAAINVIDSRLNFCFLNQPLKKLKLVSEVGLNTGLNVNLEEVFSKKISEWIDEELVFPSFWAFVQ